MGKASSLGLSTFGSASLVNFNPPTILPSTSSSSLLTFSSSVSTRSSLGRLLFFYPRWILEEAGGVG